MSAMKATLETVTPAIAEQWLENNPQNRTLSKKRVDRLIRSLKGNQWKVNGEAIKIAANGTLIDGQHRLAAVMVSKKPIETWVIRGLPLEAKSTIDIGSRRTLGNHLQMAGYTGSVFALASAIIVCTEFETGTYVHNKDGTTPEEALTFIEKNKGILRAASIFTAAEKIEFRQLLAQSISVSTYYLFSKINRAKAETFFHGLVNGASLGKTSPILKLRTELIGLRKESKMAEYTRQASLHYMTTAFQAYLDDKRIEELPEYRHGVTVITLPKN